MATIDELMLRHAELKDKTEERDLIKKRRKAAFEETLKSDMLAIYGDVDAELESTRTQLQERVALEPGNAIENSLGKLRIYSRTSGFKVNDPAGMANWLIQQKRPEVILFDKAEINKILNGLTAANLDLPGGAVKETTEVLEVKIARPASVE